MDFKIADIYQDSDLLLTASSLAEEIVAKDPEKKDPQMAALYLWEEEGGNSVDFRTI